MVLVVFTAVVVAGLFKAAMMFGPDAPFLVFQGQITDHGHLAPPVQLVLDIAIKDGEKLQPVPMIKASSLPNYRLRLSTNLKDPRVSDTAVLRAYTLGDGKRAAAEEIFLKDNKTLYKANLRLQHKGLFDNYFDEDGNSFVTFTGKIYEEGHPVPAHITLDIYHKDNHHESVSLMQVNSPSEYEIEINKLLFESNEFSRTFVLRFQSLSVLGGSALVNFTINDIKLMYSNDVELSSRFRNRPGYKPGDIA